MVFKGKYHYGILWFQSSSRILNESRIFSPVLGYIIGLPEPKQTFLKVGPRPRPSHRGRGGHHPRPRPSIGPENRPSLDPDK